MTQLNDIIERLEKATEGSWELDARVYAEAVGSDEVFNGCTLPEAIEQFPNHCGGICGVWGIPNLTTDLNAALALVEEMLGSGFLFHMGRIGPNQADDSESGHEFYFCLPEAEHVSSPNDIDATGHTLPLAVCIALLKAEEKK